MRIGVIADVHGNHVALRTALEELAPVTEEVVVSGDAFSDHRFSNEVVEAIRACGARYILGNHEMTMLSPAGVSARRSRRVSPGLLEFVGQQPLQLRTRIGAKELLVVHGSPWEPYGEYLRPGHPRFHRCDELGVDYLITGHTHMAWCERFGRTLVVNPGSLGRSDDPARPGVVTYALLDTDSDEVSLHEVQNPLLA